MQHILSQNTKRCIHLQGEIGAAYHEAALRFAMADSTLAILYTICFMGGNCPLNEVVRITGISKQTVNSALRKLEKQGQVRLLSVTPKTKSIVLTAEGETLAEKTVLRLMAAEDSVFSGWSEEDVRKYLELNERFLQNLQAHIRTL